MSSVCASSSREGIADPAAQADFERDGYYVVPAPVLPAALIERAIPNMQAVLDGVYETGVAPTYRNWKPGEGPSALQKVDDAHLSNRAILELISHRSLGEWAAAMTGAARVQVWATQLLFKPPGGSGRVNVGWHQDYQYWQYWSPSSEVFTAWVAIGDVPNELGPMRFVKGSHRWGLLNGGDFFGQDMDAQQANLKAAGHQGGWQEISGALPSGGVSFHHRLTIHGSSANTSHRPRRSFAIHLRTERSEPAEQTNNEFYIKRLADPIACPVIYG
jgi:hypothetical protein